MADLHWTTTPPTEPGWYWHRRPDWPVGDWRRRPHMVSVRLQDCEASRFNGQLVWDHPITEAVADARGEWCGPLVPPE